MTTTVAEQAAIRDVVDARRRYEYARDQWEQSIRAAIGAGASYRDIQNALGYGSLAQLVRINKRQRHKDRP